MDVCTHCGRSASTKVHIYWDCELPACENCYTRFELVRKALEGSMSPILRLSGSGRHQEALQSLHHILAENRVLDDFGWLRRHGLMMEASIYEDAGQYALAIEKLEKVRDLVSPNLSAFVQNQIAIANDLVKMNRLDDALRELERTLQTSARPERGDPHPFDIEDVLVHYAKITQGLGKDIPALHRELFVQIAEKLEIPRSAWEREASLASMALRAEQWLSEKEQRAIAGSKDPLLQPKNDVYGRE
jgi:tetratricopeptide (TPR) repeat protein